MQMPCGDRRSVSAQTLLRRRRSGGSNSTCLLLTALEAGRLRSGCQPGQRLVFGSPDAPASLPGQVLCFPLRGPGLCYKLVVKGREGLPGWLGGTESACQCRRRGLDPWVRRISWEGDGNSLQDSCLENPMDRETWRAAVRGVTEESDMT